MVLCLLNAVGWTDGGYDAIPTSADPNGGLTKRADSDEDAVVLALPMPMPTRSASSKH